MRRDEGGGTGPGARDKHAPVARLTAASASAVALMGQAMTAGRLPPAGYRRPVTLSVIGAAGRLPFPVTDLRWTGRKDTEAVSHCLP